MAIVLFFDQGRKVEKAILAGLTIDEWSEIFNESSKGSEIEKLSLKMVKKIIKECGEDELDEWIKIDRRNSRKKMMDITCKKIFTILKGKKAAAFNFERWVDIDMGTNYGEDLYSFIKEQIRQTAKTFDQKIMAYNLHALTSWKEVEKFEKKAAEKGWIELYKKYSSSSRIGKLAFENLPKTLDPNDFNSWMDIYETHRKKERDNRRSDSDGREALEKEKKFFSGKFHAIADTFEQWEKVEELFCISQVAFNKMLEKARSFNHWHKVYQLLHKVEGYKYDQYEHSKAKIDESMVLENMFKKAKALEQWNIVMNEAQSAYRYNYIGSNVLYEKARKKIQQMCL